MTTRNAARRERGEGSILPHSYVRRRILSSQNGSRPPRGGRYRLYRRMFHLKFKCRIEPNVLKQHLLTNRIRGGPRNFNRFCFAIEKTRENEYYTHALINFTDRLSTRNRFFFCFRGVNPRIRTVKSWDQMRRKLLKHSVIWDSVRGKLDSDYIRMSKVQKLNVLDQCKDKNEHLLTGIQLRLPSSLINLHWKTMPQSHHLHSFTEDDVKKLIANNRCTEDERRMRIRLQSLRFPWRQSGLVVVCGPSNVGKSRWARLNLPKPVLIVSVVDDLKFFDNHSSILIEECPLGHLSIEDQQKLVDCVNNHTIKCRYKRGELWGGIPRCLVCTNTIPLDGNDEFIRRNVILINCYGERRTVDQLWNRSQPQPQPQPQRQPQPQPQIATRVARRGGSVRRRVNRQSVVEPVEVEGGQEGIDQAIENLEVQVGGDEEDRSTFF